MANYWDIVNRVLRESDILLLVIDARIPDLTRNIEIEKRIKSKGKKFLFVINKCDLIPKKNSQRISRTIKPSVFVSGKKHFGTNILREKIMEIAHGREVTVGVVGYPNTGKSSVINMLKGRSSAGVSSVSGYTRGLQRIRVSGKMILIDTPGVIPFGQDDEALMAIIGAKNFDKVKDPELAVLRLMEDYKDEIAGYYGVFGEDPELMMELIAVKKKKISKGNVPDTKTMARLILRDWQNGKWSQKF